MANRALITRKKQTGHVLAAEQIAESRLDIVHPDSYKAVKLLSSRLVALGHERCSSVHGSSRPEDRDKAPEPVNNLTHEQHKLVALSNATPGACASEDHVVVEELKA